MSAPVLFVYCRAPEFGFYYEELRRDRHVLNRALCTQPFYQDGFPNPHMDVRTAVALSNEPWYRRVGSGIQKRLDAYKEKREKIYEVFLKNNPYLLSCNKWQNRCYRIYENEGNNSCLRCSCNCTYVCCFFPLFLIECPYNYGCRYCTGEKQWLETTMAAHPELDGRVLDHQLSSAMSDYANELNATSLPKLFDFSFQHNIRVVRTRSGENGTETYYINTDQLIMTVTNKPAYYVHPTRVVNATPVAAVVQQSSIVPLAVAVATVENCDDENETL